MNSSYMSFLLSGGEELLQSSHRNQEVNTLGRSNHSTLNEWQYGVLPVWLGVPGACASEWVERKEGSGHKSQSWDPWVHAGGKTVFWELTALYQIFLLAFSLERWTLTVLWAISWSVLWFPQEVKMRLHGGEIIQENWILNLNWKSRECGQSRKLLE